MTQHGNEPPCHSTSRPVPPHPAAAAHRHGSPGLIPAAHPSCHQSQLLARAACTPSSCPSFLLLQVAPSPHSSWHLRTFLDHNPPLSESLHPSPADDRERSPLKRLFSPSSAHSDSSPVPVPLPQPPPPSPTAAQAPPDQCRARRDGYIAILPSLPAALSLLLCVTSTDQGGGQVCTVTGMMDLWGIWSPHPVTGPESTAMQPRNMRL